MGGLLTRRPAIRPARTATTRGRVVGTCAPTLSPRPTFASETSPSAIKLRRAGSSRCARALRLTFQARNPLVFSHYWSYDPEFNNFGTTNLNRFIDLAPFPSNRQFYLSVDVGW